LSARVTNPWHAANLELETWRQADRKVRFWLRDDDACDVTAALDRLTGLTADYRIPATLAVIPARMTHLLVTHIGNNGHLHPATHGFRHLSHAGPGEKKIELGGLQPLDAVMADLCESRRLMALAFGALSPDILVPPWNRIATPVAQRLHSCGFDALSTFGWKPLGSAITELNTHIDLIDWRADRRGKPLDILAGEFAKALCAARNRGFLPIGVLSHHLAHDAAAWAALTAIFDWTDAQEDIVWRTPGDLLQDQVSL
jgi:hypothetical protein